MFNGLTGCEKSHLVLDLKEKKTANIIISRSLLHAPFYDGIRHLTKDLISYNDKVRLIGLKSGYINE